MLAHTVKVFDGSESAAPPPAAAEAPKEEWKEEAFAEMNKNVAAHDVVAPPEAKKTYKIVMIRHGESEWNKVKEQVILIWDAGEILLGYGEFLENKGIINKSP